MRKSILPRIAALLALYAIVFVVISVIQFAKQDDFNRRIGSLVVTGKYRLGETAVSEEEMSPDSEIPVENSVSIFFGGLEFRLAGSADQNNGLAIVDFDEIRRPLVPLTMTLTQNTARFQLLGGSVLAFYVQNNGIDDELIVSANLAENALAVELPYRLTKNATIANKGNANIIILLNNQGYTFDRKIIDVDREFIAFSHKNPVITYRPITDHYAFNPVDYIISGAMGKSFYDGLVHQWSEKAYSEWTDNPRVMAAKESLVNAFVAEAARTNSYNEAVKKIPEAFINSNDRTYRSSPYIGKLDAAMRSILRFEEEKTAAVEKILKDNPSDILKEYKAFDYLLQRSKSTLFDEAVLYVQSIAPDSLTLEICPGVFESWWSFNNWYPHKENPFELLVNQARLLVSESLAKDEENLRVFLVQEDKVDIFYNIRLGMAVSSYGDASKNSEWAAVGRSLVLSALSFSDNAGSVCGMLNFVDGSTFTEDNPDARLSADVLYPYLGISNYYPHAVGADTVMFGSWMWTASPAVGASYKNNILEFAVTYPLASPHYLMIFGIRPFSKIQMRNMDYRSAPDFERYNSPGWVYSPQNQTLLIKLVHRTEVETIKIFF